MDKKKEAEKKGKVEKITRKEAIKKVGVSALATTSLVFLETKASAGASAIRGGKVNKSGSTQGPQSSKPPGKPSRPHPPGQKPQPPGKPPRPHPPGQKPQPPGKPPKPHPPGQKPPGPKPHPPVKPPRPKPPKP